MESNTVLSLIDITKVYGSHKVLNSVSLEIKERDFIGICGENGAGKSTLMGIMAGTIRPTSGMRKSKSELKGEICYAPQDIALYPTLTGRQNLDFWAELYGLRGAAKRARIDLILELMKLERKANKRVETYSGGMKRRLNLAASLLIVPKLLLLDEPTVGADEQSVSVMLKAVSDMRNLGTAVVMISHIGRDMNSVCSRVITLSDGKILSDSKSK